jgi:type IV pilus assembly protein PilW
MVELVVVTAILTTLTLLVHETMRVQGASHRRESARSVTHGELRIWLARMVRDIRHAGYDPTGSGNFGIVHLSPTEIRFTADMNRNGVVDADASENLGYRMQDGTLERWQGGSSWRPVVSGLSGLQFNYFDAAGNTVTTAARAVALVEMELSAETSTGGSGGLAPVVVSRKATAETRNDP